jgi:hypothetical protein
MDPGRRLLAARWGPPFTSTTPVAIVASAVLHGMKNSKVEKKLYAFEAS